MFAVYLRYVFGQLFGRCAYHDVRLVSFGRDERFEYAGIGHTLFFLHQLVTLDCLGVRRDVEPAFFGQLRHVLFVHQMRYGTLPRGSGYHIFVGEQVSVEVDEARQGIAATYQHRLFVASGNVACEVVDHLRHRYVAD